MINSYDSRRPATASHDIRAVVSFFTKLTGDESIQLTRLMLSGILIIAAVLKATTAHPSAATPWDFPTTLIFAELLLAGLLISERMPTASWWAATLTFSCFALYAGMKTWKGDTDCGCFGSVSTPPWIAMTVDLMAVGTLLLNYQNRGKSLTSKGPWSLEGTIKTIGYASIALIGVQAALASSNRTARLSTIIPSSWEGQRLPLLADIDVGTQIATGQWQVIFHRTGCGQCEELLNKLATPNHGNNTPELAAIQLPQSHTNQANTEFLEITTGTLLGKEYRTIPAPLIVQLNEGIVREVTLPEEIAAREEVRAPVAFK